MKKACTFILIIFTSIVHALAQCNTSIQTTYVTCNGDSNGVLVFTPVSGISPYEIQTDGALPVSFSAAYTWPGLAPGPHTYMITDSANSCTDTGTIVITEPLPVLVSSITSRMNCTTTMASLSITGGTPPYSIHWTTGDTSQTVIFTMPGVYNVVVTDAQGCNGNTDVAITPNLPITITFNPVYPSCITCNDGSITAIPNGGTPPYTYMWNGGVVITTSFMMNLLPGIYTLCVTDMMGCVTCESFPLLDSSQHMISGQVYYDLNTNGIHDVSEPFLSGQALSLLPGNQTALTASDGSYYFIVAGGNYSDSLIATPGWHLTSTPGTYTVNTSGGSMSHLDFGIYPDHPLSVDVYTELWGGRRCNSNSTYVLTCSNLGTFPANGLVQMTPDPAMTFVSATPTPDSVQGSSLYWNYSGLNYGMPQSIYAVFHLPGPGSILNSSSHIEAWDSLGNIIDSSSYGLNQVVSCAVDPNDKSVNPPGVTAAHLTSMDAWLDYTIQFQNTGNDTALHIEIIDTLSVALDYATLQITGSSHPMHTMIESGSTLKFIFDRINLPDSTVDEPGSHGWVSYRIKALPGLADPFAVNNTAYIYFDQNAPVATNTTLNTLTRDPLAVHETEQDPPLFTVFPNPVKQSAYVKIPVVRAGGWQALLLDPLGKTIRDYGSVNAPGFTIEKQNLSCGNYFLLIREPEGGKRQLGKLVIE